MLKKDLNILEDINKGIGESPAFGFEDIRNLDITSQPGTVSLKFKTTALGLPPTVSAVSVTGVAATDVFTVASTSGWYNGMAIQFSGITGGSGLSTSLVYYVGDLTATTFKAYTNPGLNASTLVNFTTDLTAGSLSGFSLGKPIDTAFYRGTNNRPYIFILDNNGRAWWINNYGGTLSTNLVYLGNTTLTSSNLGRGISVMGSDLYVFRSGAYDTLDLGRLEAPNAISSGWSYATESISASDVEPRPIIVSQNGNTYFGTRDGVSRILADGTYTLAALDLPNGEYTTSLGEIGQYLLIGTNYENVYPWNKNTPSFETPIKVPEYNTQKIVGVGQLAYLFAGNSGRIYVTNGVSVQPFKKIPDQVTAQNNPLITWGDALSYDNQLYFSFSATKNDGTALNTVGGVWGIDLSTEALRLTNQASYGSYAGTTHLIIPNVLDADNFGNELIIPWANSTTYGVDYGSTSYYTSYAGYLISPQYIVGTPLEKTSINQLEIILDKPLATGEGIRVSYRPDRGTAYSGITTFDYTTYGAKQYMNFDFPATDLVTFQVKVEVTGDTTTPVLRAVNFR